MPKAKKQIKAVMKQLRQKPKKVATKVASGKGMKSIIKSVGASVGSLYGPLGSRIGSHAADYISRIMGQGDYKVSRNTLLTNNGPPTFSTNGDDVIIKHREYVKDILSTTGFSNNNYLINPGNATLFPWLSQIATSFEEYEFLGLIVEFKSTSGSAIASTNNALGTVIIATDYNCSNANMTTKRAMETVEFSTSCGTDTNMIHPIECDKTRNVLARQYTTSATSVAAVADPKFHFLGNLQFATVGQQASNINIGEFWVSYQVRLSRPIFSTLSLNNDETSSLYYHVNYVLGNWNGLVSTNGGYVINGYPTTYTAGTVPRCGFKPQTTTAVTNSLNPYFPLGLYQISYTFTLDNTGSGTLTRYDAGALPPVINNNGHTSGILVVPIDDNTTGSTSYDSVDYALPPTTIAAGQFARWSGVARVQYRGAQLGDTSDASAFYELPRHQFTGSSTGTYTVDVTMTYISSFNEAQSVKLVCDEVITPTIMGKDEINEDYIKNLHISTSSSHNVDNRPLFLKSIDRSLRA